MGMLRTGSLHRSVFMLDQSLGLWRLSCTRITCTSWIVNPTAGEPTGNADQPCSSWSLSTVDRATHL